MLILKLLPISNLNYALKGLICAVLRIDSKVSPIRGICIILSCCVFHGLFNCAWRQTFRKKLNVLQSLHYRSVFVGNAERKCRCLKTDAEHINTRKKCLTSFASKCVCEWQRKSVMLLAASTAPLAYHQTTRFVYLFFFQPFHFILQRTTAFVFVCGSAIINIFYLLAIK